jgi:hypothetical protein
MVYCIEDEYMQPHFRIEGDSAVALTGVYLKDLFLMKKKGTLRQRGHFGPPVPEPPPVEIASIRLEEISYHQKKKTTNRAFVNFAKEFLKALRDLDTSFIRKHSLDTLLRCRDTIYIDKFVEDRFIRIWDSAYLHEVVPTGRMEYDEQYTNSDFTTYEAWTKALKVNQKPRTYILRIRQPRGSLVKFNIEFTFILTKRGFKLYEYADPYDNTCNRIESPGENFTGCF